MAVECTGRNVEVTPALSGPRARARANGWSDTWADRRRSGSSSPRKAPFGAEIIATHRQATLERARVDGGPPRRGRAGLREDRRAGEEGREKRRDRKTAPRRGCSPRPARPSLAARGRRRRPRGTTDGPPNRPVTPPGGETDERRGGGPADRESRSRSFSSSATRRPRSFSVLYRRRDGNLGLIGMLTAASGPEMSSRGARLPFSGLIDPNACLLRTCLARPRRGPRGVGRRLGGAGSCATAAELAQRLLKRECDGSTGLGGGLAIPHCKLRELDATSCRGRRLPRSGSSSAPPTECRSTSSFSSLSPRGRARAPPPGARAHLPAHPATGASRRGSAGRATGGGARSRLERGGSRPVARSPVRNGSFLRPSDDRR